MKKILFATVLLICSCSVANMFKGPTKQNTDVTLTSSFSEKKTFEIFKKYFDKKIRYRKGAKEKSAPVVADTEDYNNIKTRWMPTLGAYCKVSANFKTKNGNTTVHLSYQFNLDEVNVQKKYNVWNKNTEDYKDKTVKDLEKLFSKR